MRRFRRGGVPRRLAVFFNGIVMFVVGLSVGLVTGDFDSGAFSVYFMGVGGFQAVLTGLYLAFHRKDHGDW